MKTYNREAVYQYAKKWAFSRNPKYYNFDSIGGDCTNFASQCIYAGCNEMNYNKNNGWYYINVNKRSPSWTATEFLYDFLIHNKGAGPYGVYSSIEKLEIGDIIQLSFDGIKFTHTLIVIKPGNSIGNTLIAAHTYDAFGKSVYEYGFKEFRCVHIYMT